MEASGLEGIVVSETRLSDVDGERGRLVLAGHEIESLAGSRSYEDVFALLRQAAGLDPSDLRSALGKARAAVAPRIAPTLLDRADGMDALRGAIGALPSDLDPLSIAGAVAVAAAGWVRVRRGQSLVPPDPSLPLAADYLRMIRGEPAGAAEVQGLEAYLVTVIDHGMNASTFAARVVASTGSDDVSAVTAAIGALKGPLHGGAPGPVLSMLEAIGEPAKAEAFIKAELAAGRRIMGMGHRVYRVRDPRAAVLERAIEKLATSGVARGRLDLARAVELTAGRVLKERHPDRALPANVEFYTAVLLDAVGLPREAFTPTFAVGRVGGWLSHVAEQRATGRLIRPSSRYIGPMPTA